MLVRPAWCAYLISGAVLLGATAARGQVPAAPAAARVTEEDDAPPEEVPPPGLHGLRLGLTPGIGVGFVGFTGNVAFPSFVFTTAVQAELLLELTRWGFFVRAGFLSSGASGRWTAPTVALGTQYRLLGDGEERWGLVVRGAVLYERWSAVSAQQGCDVYYFVPNSCQDYVDPGPSTGSAAPPPAFTTTADSVGLLLGLRAEVPVEPVYLAFDGELSAAADVDQSVPGVAIAGQLMLTFALRDHPKQARGRQPYHMRRRLY